CDSADRVKKSLHGGDPDLYLPFRPTRAGAGVLSIVRAAPSSSDGSPILVEWSELNLSVAGGPAIQAEPNHPRQQANPLVLGRDVYGSADDVDYLENRDEGKSGIDWFRFEVKDTEPVLVYFQLDLLDRDVSANLRVYTVDPTRRAAEPY